MEAKLNIITRQSKSDKYKNLKAELEKRTKELKEKKEQKNRDEATIKRLEMIILNLEHTLSRQ